MFCSINPFLANVPIGVFREYKMETLARNGLYGLVEKILPVNNMVLKSFNPFHVTGPSLNLKTSDNRKKQVP